MISSALIYWTLSNNSLIQRTWMFRLRITTQPWITFILLTIHYNSRWANHTPSAAALFNQDLRVAKREKRRLERMFRKSHLTVHRQLFMEACSRYNRMIDSVKSDYFRAKIDQAGNHRLFKPVDWLFTLGSPVLPTIYDSLNSMYKGFGTWGMS